MRQMLISTTGVGCAYQSTQETYSPVGSRNRLIYWSGVQSTGADMRKYFTVIGTNSLAQRNSLRCCGAFATVNNFQPLALCKLTIIDLLKRYLSILWE